ncbi:MAG: FtsX-like permease family protein, partial [bacterium]
AGRSRLIRQVLTEAVVLAVLGGALGVVIALWSTSVLSTTMSVGPVQLDVRAPSSMQSFDVRPSAVVYTLAAAAAVLAGILCGIAPALRAARTPSTNAFIGARAAIGGSLKRGRLGSGLVVAQIALSVVLLVGTGLLVRSLRNLRGQDLGIDRARLLLVWVVPAQTGRTAAEYPAYTERLLERLGALPGVVSASVTNHGLLEGGDAGGDSRLLTIDGQPGRPGQQGLRSAVGPSFFSTAGMTLLEGRDFRASDDSASVAVGIMSAAMARHFFGNASAIGHRLGTPNNPLEIIGVVKDTKHGSPRDARGVWYVSYRQFPALLRSMCVVIRTGGDPSALRPGIAKALAAFDPALPVLRVDTIGEQLDDVLFQERAVAMLSVVFALLAAVLACIGVYGVMAYGVTTRTSEIGVRVALGATSGGVLRLVLGDTIRMALIGVLVGVLTVVVGARFVVARLYGISASDPATIATAAVLMLAVAAVAGWIPAWRAASIDPARALRDG